MEVKIDVPNQAPISIGIELNRFINDIDSLADTLPNTMAIIQGVQGIAAQEMLKFGDENIDVQETSDGKLILKAALDTFQQAQKINVRIQKAISANKLIPRSFVISLVSQYDAFLGGLIRALFLIKPDSLSTSDKNISFAQLQTFASIEDAREYIIEKEIETVLRKSHSEQFDWLERKFDIKLHEGLNIWPVFIEVTERRNLFVHNSGAVTSQYLNACQTHGVELAKDIRVGTQLEATSDYFQMAYECIFEIGIKLAHVLWRKLQPGDREEADNNLNNLCFNLLVEERFKLACILLDFATDLRKYSSEQQKRMFIINRAQAYKWSGNNEKARKIIEDEDWSATSDLFKLAQAILLDDFDKADDLVKKIGSHGDVSKNNYREWPLFREYRKSEKFLKTFEEVFREPFELVVTKATEHITHSGDFIRVAIDKKDFPLDADLTQLTNYPGGILGSLWQAIQDRTQFMDLAIVRESEVSQLENHSGDNVQESQ